jgi:hypothetical protein
MIMPTKMVTKVEAIYINDARVPTAKTGENVSIKLACSGESLVYHYVTSVMHDCVHHCELIRACIKAPMQQF